MQDCFSVLEGRQRLKFICPFYNCSSATQHWSQWSAWDMYVLTLGPINTSLEFIETLGEKFSLPLKCTIRKLPLVVTFSVLWRLTKNTYWNKKQKVLILSCSYQWASSCLLFIKLIWIGFTCNLDSWWMQHTTCKTLHDLNSIFLCSPISFLEICPPGLFSNPTSTHLVKSKILLKYHFLFKTSPNHFLS